MVTSSLTQSIKPGLRHWELGGTALAGMQNLLEGDQEKGDALMSCLGFPGCLWIGITLKRENPRLPQDTQDKWFAFSMQSRTTLFVFFFFVCACESERIMHLSCITHEWDGGILSRTDNTFKLPMETSQKADNRNNSILKNWSHSTQFHFDLRND